MAMAGLGAIAGSEKDVTTQGINFKDSGQNEAIGSNRDSQYWNMINGYGVSNENQNFGNTLNSAYGSGQNYLTALNQYGQTGGLPNQSDIDTSNAFAQSMFAPQRTQMQQAYTQAGYDTQRMSAVLGRPTNDPILQAKLQTGYMNNQAQLGAQQGAFASQYAQNLPKQRLGYMGQAASFGDQLASQAFKNRAALLSMGSNIYDTNRNFTSSVSDRFTSSGGGFKGAMAGWMTGVSNDMSSMKNIMSFGGGGMMGGGGGGSGGFSGGSGYDQPTALESRSSAPQMEGRVSMNYGVGGTPTDGDMGALNGAGYGYFAGLPGSIYN